MAFSQEQYNYLTRPFEKHQIEDRPGKAGQTWKFVPAKHIIDRLNDAFLNGWSFDILSHELFSEPPTETITEETTESTDEKGEKTISKKTTKHFKQRPSIFFILGRLTIFSEGMAYAKSHIGACIVKYSRDDATRPVDLGNDKKSAATDALKKCAELFGIASSIEPAPEPKCTPTQVTQLQALASERGIALSEEQIAGLSEKEAEVLLAELNT